MNHTLTTTLQTQYYTFLQQESTRRGATKKAIIEDALALYKKHQLAEEIRIGLQERHQEYKDIQEDFFSLQSQSLKDV